MINFNDYPYSVVPRFLKYVAIDTQSDPYSQTCPSTEKQKNLARLLANELIELGVQDAHVDEHGYVYATILATSTKNNIPVICFCSHMDTSPDCSGEGVKPLIHKNYQGEDMILPDDTSQVIRLADHPDLKEQFGNDIITASGTTLLGADNKAGIAEIMDAVAFLLSHPEVEHGVLKILFTPDEEIGRGVDNVDLQKLGADFAYTIDGETLGSIENETFSADGAKLMITGVSAHPGFAKGKMESAIKIASEIVAALPSNLSPESTSGKEGFIHPVAISGTVEQAAIEFIIRDFTDEKLREYEQTLDAITASVIKAYPHSSYRLEVKEQYRNMKKVLDQYPQITANAIKAVERSGLKPKLQSIRGGTDGSRLSFMGLPCPNIFAGEHAFHSKHEWVSVQDMQKAVQTIVNLAAIWAE
ncbi:peptidase T (plasmid) [Pedobacter sp. BS3]|uniref:peptidase T n=1 Tax=Pedobacter sp. BS3 TaxID=2567937 RepID=UPI0011EE432B|nr:peptidase T [Pedobacter sp. BS3]TZF85598.1 peptidase T [Pedobacter sp. BS3]